MDMSYRYLVETQGSTTKEARKYDGPNIADAMAAWSALISAGIEYATLEAIRERT